MEIVIVTGASKGIGLSLLKQLQEKEKKVIGLARSRPSEAKHFVTVDLAETEKLDGILSAVIHEHIAEATSFTLINNAGTVEPIGLIGTVESAKVSNALSINLTAPMILCNTFIRELEAFSGSKKIMNISSGAGRKPYEGWGSYCTSKAGLDHFSRIIAVEQERASNPVEVVSIAPGIIDTGMQETIRHSSEASFPLLNRFVEYKEHGLLSSAEETAHNLISFLETADFKTAGPIADIRHL
ncbi:SDR family NAD(P)-dependent oxidoreductase [Sporosarcina pasteurii]|nr:SDR family NAD(P)-dependent oxidoreductase [Sporosarcina pasteurii]